jgi:hypothetical protein
MLPGWPEFGIGWLADRTMEMVYKGNTIFTSTCPHRHQTGHRLARHEKWPEYV